MATNKYNVAIHYAQTTTQNDAEFGYSFNNNFATSTGAPFKFTNAFVHFPHETCVASNHVIQASLNQTGILRNWP